MELIKTIGAVVQVLGTFITFLFWMVGVVLVIIVPAIYLLIKMPLIGVPFSIVLYVALPYITRTTKQN